MSVSQFYSVALSDVAQASLLHLLRRANAMIDKLLSSFYHALHSVDPEAVDFENENERGVLIMITTGVNKNRDDQESSVFSTNSSKKQEEAVLLRGIGLQSNEGDILSSCYWKVYAVSATEMKQAVPT
ncbi:hypothetical protein X801_09910 [Opisthorchis viverrini]|uniref:Uncharacterized protein n=1 Tax=Opisthorchis viverrini TaxID=6198 RepID=A0A1S8WIN5_OPIVI|nr:hypothetical protein X801_09910 [Opisthorchis viverrini]